MSARTEIGDRFSPRELSDAQAECAEALRREFAILADKINTLCPPGRLTALALTNLEQAGMWTTKAIAQEG